jgi:O-antigen ligase
MNFLSFKILVNKNKILSLLFYIFPIMMLCSSGYITAYITIFTIFCLYYFFYNKIKIKISTLDYVIIIFFLSSITSTLINFKEIGEFLTLKSILDIRFAIFFFITRIIIQYKIVCIKTFSLIAFLSVIFLSLNIFSQHIIGFDIFGHEPFDGRYNGLFESEAIAGSYIQKFFIISIIFIFFSKNNKKNKSLFIIMTIISFGLGILMSLDRMPFIIYLFILTILIFIFKEFRKTFAFGLFLLLIIFKILTNNYSVITSRYSTLVNKFELIEIKKLFLKKNFSNDELSDNFFIKSHDVNNYLRLYQASYEIFLKYPIFGSGIKSFSKECNKLEIKDKELICLTHPHNIYLEIIVNQGIVGLLTFLCFIYLLLKNFFIKLYFKKNIKEYVLNVFFLTIIISELIPIRSYGSIFQTVNGSLFWFLLAFISSKLYVNKN